ncbi:MAG: 2-polyprenylphenol 6-hydroxylase [Alphaproteobacteria bacterium]|jgi:ubiquinone biosynthesis protein
MRPSLWHIFIALLRLPGIAWHLGRAGTLGHIGRINLLPNWMQRLCRMMDRLMRSRGATKDAGGALADALLRLGPGFVKFGQALSTRADLIGPEMSLSLSQLQDRLPAFPARIARRLVESETGKPLDATFTEFTDTPVAAASIAQVHAATLIDGRRVAVKLLRPQIDQRMRSDTMLFFALASILEWAAPGLRRLKLVTAVQQFVEISDVELDLRMEAAAAGRLAENLRDDAGIYVPWVDLERSTSRMLVIEWIDGIRIDDVPALEAAGHNISDLTEAAARSFFNQVFRDGFFHADMHPGNIFVAADSRLVPIDFGIMGFLDFADRLFLARLLMAMLDRDYDMVAKLHADAGMLGDDVSLPHFAQAVRAVADPVMGKSLGEVSLGTVLGQILQLSTRFSIEVQPQFNLLQKTMMMAEGVARQLNPQADMWDLSRPLASDWMRDQAGLAKRAETFIEDALLVASRLPRLLKELEDSAGQKPTSSRNDLPIFISLLALALAILSFFT